MHKIYSIDTIDKYYILFQSAELFLSPKMASSLKPLPPLRQNLKSLLPSLGTSVYFLLYGVCLACAYFYFIGQEADSWAETPLQTTIETVTYPIQVNMTNYYVHLQQLKDSHQLFNRQLVFKFIQYLI